MKPFHTNQIGTSIITIVAVHVMHYIEPAVIVAWRLLEDVFSLIYSEVAPKRLVDFAFLTVLTEGSMCKIMNEKFHE